MTSKWNVAAGVSVLAGALGATAGILMFFDISLIPISTYERSVDQLIIHVLLFGPCIVVSWAALVAARPRILVAVLALLFTLCYLSGFLRVH